jgi:hypothetical protein
MENAVRHKSIFFETLFACANLIPLLSCESKKGDKFSHTTYVRLRSISCGFTYSISKEMTTLKESWG